MSKRTRLVIGAIVMITLTAAIRPVADVVGSIVWLFLLFAGVVSDVSSGPVWVGGLLYAPSALGYLAILALCVMWVRGAPGGKGS